jgi:DNA-binding beta-propeller fold protein YncE
MRFPAALLCSLPVLADNAQVEADRLRAMMRNAPQLPLSLAPLRLHKPSPAWTWDYVSSAAAATNGEIYVLHRNVKDNPVVVIDREGRVVRSWGRGLYSIPHSIRVDPAGNVWTVDAGNSRAIQFSPQGRKLLDIDVGGMPQGRSAFRGATDIAFAPGGRIYIADGYGNARILEYDSAGRRVRQWGSRGNGPGQFNLPHGIAVDREGILWIADRENGRIQKFDLDGRYVGEWDHLGKTFSLVVDRNGRLWIGTQPRNVANGAEGWLVKVDRKTGDVLGSIPSPGFHSIDVADGQAITGARSHPDAVIRFR